jgi:hypothetical protein
MSPESRCCSSNLMSSHPHLPSLMTSGAEESVLPFDRLWSMFTGAVWTNVILEFAEPLEPRPVRTSTDRNSHPTKSTWPSVG